MDSFFIKDNEKLEDLLIDNYKILQSSKKYRFSRDSVLLADFCEIKKSDFVVDFCSGCGIVAFLVKINKNPQKVVGLEIESEFVDMATRSKIYNKLENIDFLSGDVKVATNYFKKGSVDVVTCNPPYYKNLPQNTICQNERAKYEVDLDLKSLLNSASDILKANGKLFMSYPANRLQELCVLAKENNLFLKIVKFVKESNNNLILVKFVKNGKYGVKVE